jgi:hypothetical protein
MFAVMICDNFVRVWGKVYGQQVLLVAKKRRPGARTRKESIAPRSPDLPRCNAKS